MTEVLSDEKLPYAERIQKLRNKAASTESQEEADALFAKAQELMTKYAISEELLADAEGSTFVQDHVVREYVTYTGIFHQFLFHIGSAVYEANDCNVMIRKEGNCTTLIAIGMSRDVAQAILLDSSVQLQAAVAMKKWWSKSSHQYEWMTAFQKAKEKRAFLQGYAIGIRGKLFAAKRAGERAARDEYAAKVGKEQASKSTELVLVGKKEKIDTWIDDTYGNTLRRVSMRAAAGGYGAQSAGIDAGRSANTSTASGSVGRGTRGAIGR